MASNSKRKKSHRWISEMAGLGLFVAATLVAMSLWSYHPRDLSWFGGNDRLERSQNLAGPVGATLAEALYQGVGVGAWILPWFLAVAGWARLRPRREEETRRSILLGGTFLLFGVCALAALVHPSFEKRHELLRTGGWLGEETARLLERHLNQPGAIVLSLTVILVSLTLTVQLSIQRLGATARGVAAACSRRFVVLWARWREGRRKRRLREQVLAKQAARQRMEPIPGDAAELGAEVMARSEERPAAAPPVKPRSAPPATIRRPAETLPPPAAAGDGKFTLPPSRSWHRRRPRARWTRRS